MTTQSNAAILVVDDNEDNRYTLTRRLKREGYENLATANDGKQALEMLQEKMYDLVLLDIMMPEMNGYEVLERLKKDEARRHIPVIMITAVEDMASIVRCIELGAEDHMPKPFDATLLRARVGASLEKKRLRDEVHEWGKKLEQRVQEQIGQIDRLGRLKRFFSPQVASSLVGAGGEELLKTHRREVVIAFLDLRGFTAFTDSVEPEEVMAVLAEYHKVMGPLVINNAGTLDRFTGDGMMVYFNDPIPLEKPLANCIAMTVEMQKQFVALRDAWKKKGYNLDLGIGFAQGFATLGAIGFEHRFDYTCIGSVINHAARLCGEAKGGQILTNEKTYLRCQDIATGEPLGDMSFKGVAAPVKVYNVTGLKG
jgi:adenylate cyclase